MRPLCDQVNCKAPEEVEYAISLTYWIGSSDQKSVSEIQSRVSAAVEEFQTWQRKLGRDINPTELIARVRGGGRQAGEADGPGGHGGGKERAAQVHGGHRRLRRAGG